MSRISLYLQAIVILLACSCRDKDDPGNLATSFVDAYYVEYDFDRALALSEGAARTRLLEEKKLVDDARAKIPVAESRSRTYYETPVRRDVDGDRAHFTFELEIHHGSNDIRRTAVIMAARRQGAWKVISFREVDEGATGAHSANGVRSSTGTDARENTARPESGAQ